MKNSPVHRHSFENGRCALCGIPLADFEAERGKTAGISLEEIASQLKTIEQGVEISNRRLIVSIAIIAGVLLGAFGGFLLLLLR